MCIPLSTYQPFEHIQNLADFGFSPLSRPTGDLIDLCNKVALAAGAALLFIPVLLGDLILTPLALAYRSYYEKDPIAPPNPIAKMQTPPYQMKQEQMTDKQFFKDALRCSFEFLSEPKVQEYKDQIDTMGANDTPPINIFQWSASALIVHYLRTYFTDKVDFENLFPHFSPNPHASLGGQRENDLREAYTKLTKGERARGLLQLIQPEERMALTPDTETFLHLAQGISIEITQNQHFNRKIFLPISQDIANI